MRIAAFLVVISLSLLILFSCTEKKVETPVVQSAPKATEAPKDSLSSLSRPTELSKQFSYVYGNQIAFTLKQNYSEVDLEYLAKGVLDAYEQSCFFTEDESRQILSAFQQKLYEEADKHMKEEAVKNLAEAESFLKANAKRAGVKTVSEKLQYEVLREGNAEGKQPSDKSTVTLDYQLVDLSGAVKDSSYARGEASTMNLAQTVPGFSQAVSLMKEGEKLRVWIHPELGYGSYGNSVIGPNQLLIFDIELISVDN